MKKFWLLTTLLIGGLLLTGCNNQHYEEEYSEYWLIHWPNWDITLDDCKKVWTLLLTDTQEEIKAWYKLNEEWKMCNTPETACVLLYFDDNNKLLTPHEFNAIPHREYHFRWYEVELDVFKKITWLDRINSDYVDDNTDIAKDYWYDSPWMYWFNAYWTKYTKINN
jgi:hypothetical protein